MTFRLDDAGRSRSLRPKQQRDCTVRALAHVASFGYDRAYDILAAAGRECSTGFDIEAWCRKSHLYDGAGDHIYWRLQKMPFGKGEAYGLPKSTQRYRLMDFIKDRPKGRFIVSTARHVFAVIDGVAYDDGPWHYHENRPVYAWMEAIRVGHGLLWQAYAVRPPIKPGGRQMKRTVAIIQGSCYAFALANAGGLYEWALKGHEDLTVEPLVDDCRSADQL